jgi:hypothetical protein
MARGGIWGLLRVDQGGAHHNERLSYCHNISYSKGKIKDTLIFVNVTLKK